MSQSISSRIRAQIFLFTLTRTVINSGYRMVYPLLPLFAAGMGMQLADLSIAFSIRSALGVFNPFLASLANAKDRKNGLMLGAVLFFIGCGITAVGQNFLGFVVGLSVFGMGNGIFIPSMQAYLGDKVPFERRGTVLSITELSWSLGFIIGVPVLGSLLEKGSWVTPFSALAITGALLAAALWLLIPVERTPVSTGTSGLVDLVKALRYFPLLAAVLTGIFSTGANEMINLTFSVWIKDSFGLDFAALTIASVIIGTSELGSELLSVAVLDKIGKHRAMRLALILNGLVALVLPLTRVSFGLALAGLALFYVSFEFALISLMTIVSEVLPHARAAVLSLLIAALSLGRMLGPLFSPALYESSFWLVCLAAAALNAGAFLLVPSIRVNPQSVPAES